MRGDTGAGLFTHASTAGGGYGYTFAYNGDGLYSSRYGVSTAVLFIDSISLSTACN